MITTSKITTTDVKRYNKNRIFQLIYTTGKISRQEIADVLQLSLPTVNQNLKILFEKNLLIYEGNFESTGGRKAQVISINGAARYVISVNLSDKGIKADILDLNCNVIGNMRVPVKYEKGSAYGEMVADTVTRLVEHTGIDKAAILGVGITVPGIFDIENSTVVYAPTMGIKNYSLENIQRLLPYECRGMNDARSGAFAEYWFDKKDINPEKREGKTYLMLNTGVGGSYIDRENIRFGKHNRYGEFGHMTLYPAGRPCFCGKRGCFESYVSARCLSTDLGITLDIFFDKLENGNEEYKKIFDKYLDDLTTGINKYVLPNSNILSKIRIKRRKYPKGRRHLITKQFGKQPTYFVRCTVCRIQQECDPSRLVTHGIHKTMYFLCIKRLTHLYILFKFLRCHIFFSFQILWVHPHSTKLK